MKSKKHLKASNFLAPKFWPWWIGLWCFKILMLLPYPILLQIGIFLGWIFSKLSFGKKRIQIAKRNLELCFPDLSASEINKILKQNIANTGLAIIETGMAWFWSDRRILKISQASGIEHLKNAHPDGILLIGVHFLNLELGARIIGLHHAGIGVYRPNDNPFFDWLQIKGRLKSNKDLIDRNNLRAMLQALKKGEMLWYAPDHDYGRNNAVFVPFFAVKEASTTKGTRIILKAVTNVKVIPFLTIRKHNKYYLTVEPSVNFENCEDTISTAILMNQTIEQIILKAPEQYMWLHRRFKTRPDPNEPSFYE